MPFFVFEFCNTFLAQPGPLEIPIPGRKYTFQTIATHVELFTLRLCRRLKGGLGNTYNVTQCDTNGDVGNLPPNKTRNALRKFSIIASSFVTVADNTASPRILLCRQLKGGLGSAHNLTHKLGHWMETPDMSAATSDTQRDKKTPALYH